MVPHTRRAERAPSPSAKASAPSPGSGAGRGSLVGSWLFFSLGGDTGRALTRPRRQPRTLLAGPGPVQGLLEWVPQEHGHMLGISAWAEAPPATWAQEGVRAHGAFQPSTLCLAVPGPRSRSGRAGESQPISSQKLKGGLV